MAFPDSLESFTEHQSGEIIKPEATNDLSGLARRVTNYIYASPQGSILRFGDSTFGRLAAWATTVTFEIIGNPDYSIVYVTMPNTVKTLFGKPTNGVGFDHDMLIFLSVRVQSGRNGNPRMKAMYMITGNGLEVTLRPVNLTAGTTLSSGYYVLSVLVLGKAADAYQATS